MIIFLSWIATILCILGNILVVKKKNGFLIWFIGTGILLVLAIMRKDWAQVFLFTIYEIINIKGFFEWRKKNGGLMKTVFLICGESSSGKDSLAAMLKHDGYKVLKSYTTRPKRINESNTHIFIKPEDVAQYKNDMIAYTKIGTYEYFATKQQLLDSDVYIIDPKGIEYLKSKIKNIKFITIFINVPEEERKKRALYIRKDDPEAVEKRFEAERKQFDNFKLNTGFDYSICNYDLNKAYKILKFIIETESEGELYE